MDHRKYRAGENVRHQRRVKVTALALGTVVCIVALNTALCRAGESKDGFSLGYGSLRPVTTTTTDKQPGVVTAKYGFSLLKDFTPYIGTGLAYVLPQESIINDASTKLKTGLAGQAGISFNLGSNSSLSIDYKYLHFINDPPNSDKGTPPQSVGVGVNIKF